MKAPPTAIPLSLSDRKLPIAQDLRAGARRGGRGLVSGGALVEEDREEGERDQRRASLVVHGGVRGRPSGGEAEPVGIGLRSLRDGLSG